MMFLVNMGANMSNSKKKKKAKKTKKVLTRARESIDCLFELHKLQGILLSQLKKEIKKK